MTPFGEPEDRPRVEARARHETVLDMDAQRVAKVYAEALLRAAEKRGEVDELLQELDSLLDQVLQAEPQFEAFLSSGAVGRDRKANVLRSVFAGRASELFVNWLLVLNDHDRLDLLRPIVAAYRELREQRRGLLRVQVRSAEPLPEDQQERLRLELRQAFHKEPLLEIRIDPELLGGVVVRVGDWLYDHSVRTELESIRNQIIARSSYEIQSRRDRFCVADGN